MENIAGISHIVVQTELEALLLEANLIKKYQPKYNVELKDGKSYPLIKITLKEDYPRVILARREEADGSRYFGPYPDTKTLRFLLRRIRFLFPFCSCRNHPRSCLYHHLNLCPLPEHEMNKEEYQKTIKKIVLFLDGKKTLVVKNLQKDMERAARNLDFEKAAGIKKQLERIETFTKSPVSPENYEENPDLLKDRRQKELDALSEILHLHAYLKRIECYDISNLSGKEATASLVVLTDGEIDKSQYRRFKIRTKNQPDDYAMLKEVFFRRFKHREWEMPDLMVVDGGRGQLNILLEVQQSLKLQIPSIGLAKKYEEIHTPVSIIRLPADNPSLLILKKIRDESHRFAKKYHHLLRSKKFLSR